jgi:hypothetical protein
VPSTALPFWGYAIIAVLLSASLTETVSPAKIMSLFRVVKNDKHRIRKISLFIRYSTRTTFLFHIYFTLPTIFLDFMKIKIFANETK